MELLSDDGAKSKLAIKALARPNWRNAYACMVLDALQVYLAAARLLGQERLDAVRTRTLSFLSSQTHQSFDSLREWRKWTWSQPYEPHPDLGEFKGMAYSLLDRRMREFFSPGVRSALRLDEVEWGGVLVNGIPPLDRPATIVASEAGYLKDSNVVFGVEAGGAAKAYPKRILAWHEMALDRVGGVDLAIVYCTLCGTVIPYRASAGGRTFTFGTSGLLYQSSKLMFDHETKSLWPTLQGQPMIGPLTGSGLALDFVPVVTTTWGEWRELHPRTQVLALDTGHKRDYSEGAAYREYFASPDLMFDVSRTDKRLRSKDEILAIRLPGKTALAISVRLLRDRKGAFEYVHQGVRLRVETTPGGANRVFADGISVPAHRAFWFGWYAQFPGTVLLK